MRPMYPEKGSNSVLEGGEGERERERVTSGECEHVRDRFHDIPRQLPPRQPRDHRTEEWGEENNERE